MSEKAPTEFRIASTKITQSGDEAYYSDGRGIVWLYEPPSPRARYVMGVDAAQGRTGWNRFNQSEEDGDNGAIVVIRCGSGELGSPGYRPDTQVAEYAAPIDPYDLAKVANALGRMYGGRDEEGQALAIIEVYPGPGGPTQRTMMETYGYTNMYRWQFLDTGMPSEHSKFDYGWYSTKQSMQHLWTKGLRYIHRKQMIFKSTSLVEEFADAQMDTVRMRGQATSGHDDRVMAALLAIWAAHNWSFSIEPAHSSVHQGPAVEWQATDISADALVDAWEEKWAEIARESDQSSA